MEGVLGNVGAPTAFNSRTINSLKRVEPKWNCALDQSYPVGVSSDNRNELYIRHVWQLGLKLA